MYRIYLHEIEVFQVEGIRQVYASSQGMNFREQLEGAQNSWCFKYEDELVRDEPRQEGGNGA